MSLHKPRLEGHARRPPVPEKALRNAALQRPPVPIEPSVSTRGIRSKVLLGIAVGVGGAATVCVLTVVCLIVFPELGRFSPIATAEREPGSLEPPSSEIQGQKKAMPTQEPPVEETSQDDPLANDEGATSPDATRHPRNGKDDAAPEDTEGSSAGEDEGATPHSSPSTQGPDADSSTPGSEQQLNWGQGAKDEDDLIRKPDSGTPDPLAEVKKRNNVLGLPLWSNVSPQPEVELVKILVPQTSDCEIEIEGFEGVFGDDNTVELKQSDAQGSRMWTAVEQYSIGGEVTSSTLAVFRLENQSLLFKWGPAQSASPIRFCRLNIRAGASHAHGDLVSPVIMDPLTIDSSKQESWVSLPVPPMPRTVAARLRVDLDLHGFPKDTELSADIEVALNQTVTIKTYVPNDEDSFPRGNSPLLEVDLELTNHPDQGYGFVWAFDATAPSYNATGSFSVRPRSTPS